MCSNHHVLHINTCRDQSVTSRTTSYVINILVRSNCLTLADLSNLNVTT